ncbi:MAG: DUF3634 family protein [Ectothiorhodospiraceae bacterium]|nr:DUF3634 family protein [Ectothiorhodospiraceae bacterium]MCH8504156.1 DUF3634 family protein [Ectothiorhodospiraceae bacterium]
MNPAVVTLVLAALAGAVALYLLYRPKTVFLLQVRDSQVSIGKGSPPADFVSAVEDVCRMHDVQAGKLWQERRHGELQLVFSKDFPARAQQACRNVWTPPPPDGGGSGGRRAAG